MNNERKAKDIFIRRVRNFVFFFDSEVERGPSAVFLFVHTVRFVMDDSSSLSFFFFFCTLTYQ